MKVETTNWGQHFHFDDGTKVSIRKDNKITSGCYSYQHRYSFNGRPLTKELAKKQYDAISIDEYVPNCKHEEEVK